MTTKCECDNCGHVCEVEELAEIQNFWERVDTGGEIPAGECPQCGALSYLAKATTPKEKAARALDLLCEARDLLKAVGAVKTLARVRHAISSAKGAIRAPEYREYLAEQREREDFDQRQYRVTS